MVKAFDKLATRNNISYFLWAGTLLGVYRNGTILVLLIYYIKSLQCVFILVKAWDEDFDLAVEKRHMEVIQKKIGKMVRTSSLQRGERRNRCIEFDVAGTICGSGLP